MRSFQSLNKSNPEFMWSYFKFKNITYNIRNGPLCMQNLRITALTLIPSILGHAFCGTVFPSLLNSESILELKRKLKELGNADCSCILCR